jgi:hypothetical protein
VLAADISQDPLGSLSQGHRRIRPEQYLPGSPRQREAGTRDARREPAGLAATRNRLDVAPTAFPVSPGHSPAPSTEQEQPGAIGLLAARKNLAQDKFGKAHVEVISFDAVTDPGEIALDLVTLVS